MSKSIVECLLCPKKCKLAHKQRGDCRVRFNQDGKLITLIYGKPCAVHVDPIEKKPMFHFIPGTGAFSIATAGCNLHCIFCQNWEISQANPEDTRNSDLPPEAVVRSAKHYQCRSIAYTYSEPMIFYEYVYDTAQLAREQGIKNVLVTAGYINEEPLRKLCKITDGANVDLKGFTDRYYREVCFGRLKPVLRCLEIMKEEGMMVEVTNLIIPTLNDDLSLIEKMCKWIVKELGDDVPLHFSRFSPRYKLKSLYPTPAATLKRAAELAKQVGLKYVYIGNVPGHEGEDTLCPQCGRVVIDRSGYRVNALFISDGQCQFCNQKIAGVWQ